MRKRLGWGWMFAVAVAPVLSGALSPAGACQQCTVEMWCQETARGGALCLGSGDWCAMAGKCSGGKGAFVDSYAMVQVSLLEGDADAPGGSAGSVGSGAARVRRGIGPLAVGRHALRAAREAGGPRAAVIPEGALAFSGVGVLDGTSAVFRSAIGDGFVLRRDRDGRGGRVSVRELRGDRPGRELAAERLDERDALVVGVTLDGRPRVLVVQVATLQGAEARERVERCREAIAELPRRTSPFEPPLFELRALDD